MLISAKIENFRSIKESLILDFKSMKKIDKKDLQDNFFELDKSRILKSLIFYGRNAAGKSNILLALQALNYLIENSDKFKHKEEIGPYEPYLFDTEMKKKPVRIEIEFYGLESKHKFKYSVCYNQYYILEESLYFYPQGVKTKLYERNTSKVTYGESFKGTKKAIEKDLLPNQLFLSKSANYKVEYLDEVYLNLTRHFYVTTVNNEIEDTEFIRIFSEFSIKEKKFKNNLVRLLKSADTNIIDFDIKENDENSFKFPKSVSKKRKQEIIENLKYDIKTKHLMFSNGKEIGTETLEIGEESLGTKKLLSIGGRIIDTLDDGGIIIIDELDKGLHPLLTRMLIKLFHSKKNNPKNAQLIFATHDGTLMDLDLFRRDQICFVEKEYEGNSTITKLSEYRGVRKGIPLEKWYLSGRFKGIPVINDVELEF